MNYPAAELRGIKKDRSHFPSPHPQREEGKGEGADSGERKRLRMLFAFGSAVIIPTPELSGIQQQSFVQLLAIIEPVYYDRFVFEEPCVHVLKAHAGI